MTGAIYNINISLATFQRNRMTPPTSLCIRHSASDCLGEPFGVICSFRYFTPYYKARENDVQQFASILRNAQCESIELEEEEAASVESEAEDHAWSGEEGDEENTSQQLGSSRFGEMEVSKENVGFTILYSLKIRLNLQLRLGG